MKKILSVLLLLGLCLVGPAEAKVRGGAEKSDKTTLMGANIGCMACGGVSPGTPGVDWIPPTLTQMQYLRSKNLVLFRMPVKWERIQSNVASDTLNTPYMDAIKQAAVDAESVGGCILLDMHSYGSHNGLQVGAPGGPTYAQYGNAWKLIANELKDYDGICGYDLMNENNSMWSNVAAPSMFQAAITQIRTVDMDTPIYVEGDAYASTYGWMGDCPNCGGAPLDGWAPGGNDQLKNLIDPADKLVFSGHAYGDANGSGIYPDDENDLFGGPECEDAEDSWDCATALGDQLSGKPLDTNIMVRRFTPFVQWCKREKLKCHIGENGVPNDNPNWLVALDKGIEYLQANDIEYTYWNAAGVPNDPLNVDRRSNGQDAVQMAVLTKYSNAIPPRTYTITGPEYGDEDTPSTNFTIQYNGLVKDGAVTFTPDDNGAGGTFTPSSVTINPGFNAQATFTYTAPDDATYEITALNNKGWAAPDRIGYTTLTDQFRANNVTPYKVISTQRVYAPYIGPCVTLRRASDNAVETFGWESLALNAKCNQTAISDWANGSNVYVVTMYDQTPNNGDWVAPVSDGSAVGAPSNADQPQFVLNYQNGLPALLFSNSRMQTVSPFNNLTGHTLMAVFRPASQLSQASLIQYGWGISGTDQLNAFGADIYSNTAMAQSQMRSYSNTTTWSAAAASFSTADGGTMYAGGQLVNRTTAGGHTTNSPYRTYATIGFPVFSANRYAGFAGEMFTFQSKISDSAMNAIQDDQVSRWNMGGIPNRSLYSPTLSQNTGTTENSPPWMGVGGTGGYQYFGVTPTATYPYWASLGANIYRYVVLWETMQPNLCTGNTTISPTALAAMDAAVTAATAAGLDVLIDLHNYGVYNYSANGTCASPPDDGKISNTTTRNYFVDYWTQIANHYAGNYKVKFDIMNEPHNVTDAQMMTAADAVIDSIRALGHNHWVFVEFGTGYSACGNVASNGGPAFLSGVSDTANRAVLTCHQYITPCGYDACGPNSNNGQGKSSLTAATTYVKANNIKLFWGEAGIAAYGPQQYAETKNALDYIAANLDTGTGGWVGWNVWGAGTWGESYTFKLDPWSYTTPYAYRPAAYLLNTYFTGHSWKCTDGSTGTAGVCPGTWPAAEYP